MGQEIEIDVTCGAPACDFSVDSVVIEGPSMLGPTRQVVGGRGGADLETAQWAGSSRPCAVVARGHSYD